MLLGIHVLIEGLNFQKVLCLMIKLFLQTMLVRTLLLMELLKMVQEEITFQLSVSLNKILNIS